MIRHLSHEPGYATHNLKSTALVDTDKQFTHSWVAGPLTIVVQSCILATYFLVCSGLVWFPVFIHIFLLHLLRLYVILHVRTTSNVFDPLQSQNFYELI